MWGTSAAEAWGAAALVAIALGGLAAILFNAELGAEARRRRGLHRTAAAAHHTRLAQLRAVATQERTGLTPAELARLAAFRPRARLMAGESLAPPTWWSKLQALWREGYAGWIIAGLAGAFSMATHFGLWWLVAGGGWLGAALVTIGSTVLMVGVAVWLMLGLIPR